MSYCCVQAWNWLAWSRSLPKSWPEPRSWSRFFPPIWRYTIQFSCPKREREMNDGFCCLVVGNSAGNYYLQYIPPIFVWSISIRGLSGTNCQFSTCISPAAAEDDLWLQDEQAQLCPAQEAGGYRAPDEFSARPDLPNGDATCSPGLHGRAQQDHGRARSRDQRKLMESLPVDVSFIISFVAAPDS